jgi:hypothetical protein
LEPDFVRVDGCGFCSRHFGPCLTSCDGNDEISDELSFRLEQFPTPISRDHNEHSQSSLLLRERQSLAAGLPFLRSLKNLKSPLKKQVIRTGSAACLTTSSERLKIAGHDK